MAIGGSIDGVGARQLYLDINAPVDEWMIKLREFKPNIVIGYPSAVKILGELIERGAVSLDVKQRDVKAHERDSPGETPWLCTVLCKLCG